MIVESASPPPPTRCTGSGADAAGEKSTEEAIREAALRATEGREMNVEQFASSKYRRHLAQAYTVRMLKKILM